MKIIPFIDHTPKNGEVNCSESTGMFQKYMQKPKCSNLLQEVQWKDNNERNKTWLFRFIVLIIFNIYSVLYMFLSIYLMYLIKVLVLWISLSLDEVIYWYRTSKTLQRLLLQRLPLRRLYHDAEKSVKTFLNRSILNEVDMLGMPFA